VLPIVNRLRFVQTFQKLFGEAGGKPTTPTVDRAPAEYTAGSWKLAFGDDGSALITDNVGLLRRILATQQQNLAYFHSSDRQSTGFLKLAATRQGRNDAWVRGAIRATTAAELANAPTSPFALLSDVQFAIGFDPQAARIEVRGKLPDVRSELISRLLAPLSANRAKASELLERSEAGIVLADDALSTFIRYLASGIAEESAASFNAIFPELLHELRHFTTLTHIGIAPRQLSERVPGVIAGLTMSKDEADALVFRLQSSLRLKRDREVVRGAIERYRERTPSERAGSPAVQADALLAAGLLRPDRDALWSRYRRLDARRVASMTPEPALAPNDFVGESYVKRRAEGFELRYVMPPVTDDDLDYRLVEERGKIESEDLKRDRYRLCAVYISGTLWLGTDADLLDRWLELLRSDSATNEFRDLASIRPSADDAKLSALALPRQLLESGQLYPDWNVNRTTRLMLADFSQYRTALMTMTTRRGERELDVAVTFRR